MDCDTCHEYKDCRKRSPVHMGPDCFSSVHQKQDRQERHNAPNPSEEDKKPLVPSHSCGEGDRVECKGHTDLLAECSMYEV